MFYHLGIESLPPELVKSRRESYPGRFTGLHLVPHAFGIVLFLVCTLLPYANHYKGKWIFLLAPAGSLGNFAHDVHGLFWSWFIAVPHALVLVPLGWWGIPDAALLIGYSLALASIYLALELRLIDSVPFTQQADAYRSP